MPRSISQLCATYLHFVKYRSSCIDSELCPYYSLNTSSELYKPSSTRNIIPCNLFLLSKDGFREPELQISLTIITYFECTSNYTSSCDNCKFSVLTIW